MNKLNTPCPPPPAPAKRTSYGRSWVRLYQNIGAAPSATKQEFLQDSDINNIMRKYQRTGALTHFAKFSPMYGDFSPCDLQEAQNLVNKAAQMFAELPSSIRNLTQSPAGFLEFIQDPKNASQLEALGLIKSPPPIIPAPPTTPVAPNA